MDNSGSIYATQQTPMEKKKTERRLRTFSFVAPKDVEAMLLEAEQRGYVKSFLIVEALRAHLSKMGLWK